MLRSANFITSLYQALLISHLENTADIGTKPVKKDAPEYLMQKMGFEALDANACERT